jgi:hypothetical protein
MLEHTQRAVLLLAGGCSAKKLVSCQVLCDCHGFGLQPHTGQKLPSLMPIMQFELQ